MFLPLEAVESASSKHLAEITALEFVALMGATAGSSRAIPTGLGAFLELEWPSARPLCLRLLLGD